MKEKTSGELVPVGGGDTIPLIRDKVTIGRRESCDVCLRYPNISGKHCELTYQEGYWMIRDLGSTNGIKVNGIRVGQKPLHPGDEIAIASRKFTIEYNLTTGRRVLDQMIEDDIMDQPLLEKAGLVRPKRDKGSPVRRGRVNPMDLEQLLKRGLEDAESP